ncbi:MAG TPA: MBOAT family protein [Verrucomicrobiae bacterium]|nr:MBOAT family protein [Verrucomicrobiae bacterium]
MLAVELTADVGNRLSRRERWRIRPQSITKAQVLREIVNILIHAIVVWIALQILLHPRNFGNFTNELLRLGAGVALLYASAAIIFGVISLLFEAAGYSSPQLHRHPIAARSVGEFWGRRWNIIVSAWLRTFVFLPIARRNHIGLGIILAFLASGILHGWLILFSVGLWGALSQVLFFVIQGVVVLAENRLRIDEWPVAIARAWTLIILLATSPLFIDPGLRFFGL